MTRWSEWAVKLSLVVLSTVVTLGIAEIGSRFLYHVEIAHFVDCHGRRAEIRIDDPELEFRLRPNFCGELVGSEFRNSMRTNGAGYRDDKEFIREKYGAFRILGLGDSYAMGWGVEPNQTYLSLLGKKLQGELNRPVETYNLGVWGYGTLQEVRVFRTFRDYHSDLVILELYARDAFVQEAGNDLVDNYRFHLWYRQRGAPPGTNLELRRFEASRLNSFKSFVQEHCNLCRIAFLEVGGYLKGSFHPSGNEHLRELAWQLTGDALKDFDRDLGAMHLTCLLLWVPPPGTVRAKERGVLSQLASMGLHSIVVVNPLDALAEDIPKYYYALDTHFRPAGHELAADLLEQKIFQMRQGHAY